MRFAIIRSLAIAAICGLWAGITPAVAATPTGAPYELNAILSTTGAGAFLGANAAKTMKIIEDLTNASGGINGRPLKIIVSDDQSKPEVAVQLTNELMAKKVAVILGPSLTATCAANGPLVTKSGPVIFCVSPYLEPTPGGFVFVNGPTASDNAAVVLQYYRERGFTRIAMLNATDASGQVLDKAFDAAFALPENKGLQLVAHQHFAPTDVSVAAQIAQIKTSNAQVLIGWTVGSPFQTLVRAAHDGGLNIPICTNGANMTTVQIQQLAGYLPDTLEFASYPSWVPGSTVPKNVGEQQAKLYAAFKAAGIHLDGGYASVWDLTTMTIDALRHLPANPTSEQVRAYLNTLHGWAGANGVYDFRDPLLAQRGIGRNGYIIDRFDPEKSDFVPASLPGGKLK